MVFLLVIKVLLAAEICNSHVTNNAGSSSYHPDPQYVIT